MVEHASDKFSALLGVGRWYGAVVWGHNYCFFLGEEMVQNMVFIVKDSLKQGLVVQLAELTKCWKVEKMACYLTKTFNNNDMKFFYEIRKWNRNMK